MYELSLVVLIGIISMSAQKISAQDMAMSLGVSMCSPPIIKLK